MTLNNPQDEELQAINDLDTRYVKYAIFGQEVGESGTPHVQAFIQFKNAKTLTATKKFMGSNRWHLEATRGTPFENYEYCSKDGEFFEYGERPLELGPLDMWEDIVAMIEGGFNNRQIIRKYPSQMRCMAAIERYRTEYEWNECQAWRDIEVNYVAGPTGCGKSRGVLYNDDGSVDYNVYRATNGDNPFDKYDGQDHIVFEEFRNSHKCKEMLMWIEGHPLLLPARYADRMAKFTKVTILSNWRFEEQFRGVAEASPETYKAWKRRVQEEGTVSHLWPEDLE